MPLALVLICPLFVEAFACLIVYNAVYCVSLCTIMCALNYSIIRRGEGVKPCKYSYENATPQISSLIRPWRLPDVPFFDDVAHIISCFTLILGDYDSKSVHMHCTVKFKWYYLKQVKENYRRATQCTGVNVVMRFLCFRSRRIRSTSSIIKLRLFWLSFLRKVIFLCFKSYVSNCKN